MNHPPVYPCSQAPIPPLSICTLIHLSKKIFIPDLLRQILHYVSEADPGPALPALAVQRVRTLHSEGIVNLEDAQTGVTPHHLRLQPPMAPAAHKTTFSIQINCTFVPHCSPSLRNIPGKAKSGQGEGSWNNQHLVHHKESLSAWWPRQGAVKHMDSLSSHESTRQTAALPTHAPVLEGSRHLSQFVGCPWGHLAVNLGFPQPPWTSQQTHQVKAFML